VVVDIRICGGSCLEQNISFPLYFIFFLLEKERTLGDLSLGDLDSKGLIDNRNVKFSESRIPDGCMVRVLT